MNLKNSSIKNIFKAFLLFAILYNGYRYFFPWDISNKPLVPFYFSILKDVPWALVVLAGLTVLFRKGTSYAGNSYQQSEDFNTMKSFFVFTHLVLLAIAVMHLSHKNPIDIFQRDIKNVQYIFLPFLFPLLINKEKDVSDYANWIMTLGVIVCVFGFSTYLFIPHFTWSGAVLSTFQSPICFGTFTVMLFVILLSRSLVEKNLSLFWYPVLFIFYGSILTTASFAALLSMIVGILFLLISIRPSIRTCSKVGALLIVSSLLFFNIGLFDKFINKFDNSYSSYKAASQDGLYEEKPKENKENADTSLSWDFFSKPYEPTPDNTYHFQVQYTSIAARKVYLQEISTYLITAPIKDLLLGDFSLKNHFEYDNVYFYFIKNDGIIVTVLLIILLCSGVIIGLKKYIMFIKSGNYKMASLSIGIAAFLFTSILIQFNLSYFLTIYPHNFLTYFFLILIFFINPAEPKTNRSSGADLYDK